MRLPRARDPREARPARHPPAAEGRGVSGGRTARRDAPSGAPAVAADAHSTEPVPRSPPPRPARPAAPGRMRKTRQSGDGGHGDARLAAGPDPGRPSPTPARAPGRPRQLLTSSPGGCARPPLTQISAARTARGGTQGPQPRTPSPPARLPPGRPGARSGCSLASLRTTDQPSCAPSPRRSTPLALLRSFAPWLPPISSSPSAAAPPPTASPPPHP